MAKRKNTEPVDDDRQDERTIMQAAFIGAYVACGRVTTAAAQVGIDRTTHYLWMKDDPTYQPRLKAAIERTVTAMEVEAVERAIHGVEDYVLYKGEPVQDPDAPPDELRFLKKRTPSDRLLEILLKAHDPLKYRERNEMLLSGQVQIDLNARMEQLQRIVSDVAGNADARAAAYDDRRRRAERNDKLSIDVRRDRKSRRVDAVSPPATDRRSADRPHKRRDRE